jgi:hypothetical protein
MARPGDVDEIFTDLHGNPDPVVDSDLAVLDGDDLADVDVDKGGKAAKIDPDLLVADDDEDDAANEAVAAAAIAAAAAAEEEEEEEVEDKPAAAAVSDFDPKDVQIVLLETRNLEAREERVKSDKARAESDLLAAKAELERAKEAGETKAEIAAMEKFADAKTAHGNAVNALENIEGEKRGLAGRARDLIAKAPKNEKGEAILDGSHRAATVEAPAKAKGSKLIPKFQEKNPWFSDAKYAAQAATLRGIDAGMAAEKKLNKNDPAYFDELGRRFNKVYPGLYKGLDGKVIATGQRQRGSGTPVPGSGGGGGGNGGGGERGGKVKITREDLVQMPKFGMDPSNMKHRAIWLTEKRAQERGAA